MTEVPAAHRDSHRDARVAGALACLPTSPELRCSSETGRGLFALLETIRSSSRTLLIAPDEERAARWESEARVFAEILGGLGAPATVRRLPFWEASPQSPLLPSLRTAFERVRAIRRLVAPSDSGAAPELWIASAPALLWKTAPASLWRESLEIAPGGGSPSRAAVAARLIEWGYLKSDTVEDPGTFAARGEILDVFDPLLPRPVRIEFFDVEVERIRAFDPSTQRTLEPTLASLRLGPCRELDRRPDTLRRLRESLKRQGDDLGVPRQARDPVLASVTDAGLPPRSVLWAAHGYGEEAIAPADLLASGTRLLFDDRKAVLAEFKRIREEQAAEIAVPARAELLTPGPDAGFSGPPTTWSRAETGDLSGFTGERGGPVTLAGHAAFGAGWEKRFDFARAWLASPDRTLVVSARSAGQIEKLRILLEERGVAAARIRFAIGGLPGAGIWEEAGWLWLDERDLLAKTGRRDRTAPASEESGTDAAEWSGLGALADIAPGDVLVHRVHGKGRYVGLTRVKVDRSEGDFLVLEYAGADRLYVPAYRLDVIQKFAGADGETAAGLSKLGTTHFQKAKERVRQEVRKLAFDLLRIHAERKLRPGAVFPAATPEVREFEARFPFDETPDQAKAIAEVFRDLGSARVMDRLVCGDVGYGKTEVAMRAAFAAVEGGAQVAVLVPTTVLCFQHEQTFRARFADSPFLIESASRFRSIKEVRETLKRVAEGKVDILVGTHRLLSDDVKFDRLGLVIVDEEHRFGVEHKEKLKALCAGVHVLTLTATPIPRTLHLALSGLRDISLIRTPPSDRLPIRTYVSSYDEEIAARAIEQELARGGQVYFLHNRVETIHKLAARLRELVPRARVGVAHGQMPETELERAMAAFFKRETDVLVTTTIIESGLDVPTANTLIVDRADRLGLAQLYQIRGRVGRGQERASAYLFVGEALSEDARRRLEVIQRFVELGAGFQIASHDLELRGGGDLLGAAQSGHVAEVGFDLYLELLEDAVREARERIESGETDDEPRRSPGAARDADPEIKIALPAFLPEDYVPDAGQRLLLYRRLSRSATEEDLVALERELADRFGPPPEAARNLLWLVRLRQELKRQGIDSLTLAPERVTLIPGPSSRFDPARVIARVAARPGELQLTPDSKLVFRATIATLPDLHRWVEKVGLEFATDLPNT